MVMLCELDDLYSRLEHRIIAEVNHPKKEKEKKKILKKNEGLRKKGV